MKLTIVIPVYNEEATISKLIEKVKNVKIEGITKEIIVIDDCSTDNTKNILKRITGIKLISHEKNMGKGAGIKSALKCMTGDIILTQDADLEYDPSDYPKLMEPFLKANACVVYGSRLLLDNPRNGLIFSQGGLLATRLTNWLYKTNLTDLPTGYKAYKREVLEKLILKENGFALEPEITIKLLKRNIKIIEVPISYNPRTVKEGKKIKIFDAFPYFWQILKQKWSD